MLRANAALLLEYSLQGVGLQVLRVLLHQCAPCGDTWFCCQQPELSSQKTAWASENLALGESFMKQDFRSVGESLLVKATLFLNQILICGWEGMSKDVTYCDLPCRMGEGKSIMWAGARQHMAKWHLCLSTYDVHISLQAHRRVKHRSKIQSLLSRFCVHLRIRKTRKKKKRA